MALKTEVSSGGIIIRKHDKKTDVLLLKDMSGNWTFPKGLIDPGETPEVTAKREIAEEVGIHNLELVSPVDVVEYWYVRSGEKIKKTVHYFLFTTDGFESPVPQGEEGITEVQYFPLEKAHMIIGYKQTNDELLSKAEHLL